MMYLVSVEMIKRYHINPKYLVFNEKMVNYLLDRNISSDKIIMLNEKISFGSWDGEPVDESFLIQMETQYGIPNLYLYWEAVRGNYEKYDHYSTLKTLETIFRVYLDFLEKEQFDFALVDLFPASIPMLVMSRILDQKETPCYFLT